MARSLSRTEAGAYDHVPRDVAGRARLYRVRRLSPGAGGMTLGRRVLLRRGREADPVLIAHELGHVAQFADRGRARFLARYLADYAHNLIRLRNHRQAYLAIPAEIEAREAAGSWADDHPEAARGR